MEIFIFIKLLKSIVMHRRTFIQSAVFATAAFSGIHKAFSMLKDDPAWKIRMLNSDVGIFLEKGGTIMFHLSPDGITVIDAQFPDSAAHLITELKKKNIPVRLLINTHHHADHTSGNIAFKDLTNRVLAHENSLANQRRVAAGQKDPQVQYFPNQTFKELWSEKSGKETISLHYYGAAHTNGDAVIHLEKNNIAHVGDLVFNRRHPYIDRSAGANIQSWIDVLENIKKRYNDKTTFVCGHSNNGFDVVGNKEMIKDFQSYLINALAFVKEQIASKKSLDEILKTSSIPGSPEWEGEGIERTLKAAYEELTEV